MAFQEMVPPGSVVGQIEDPDKNVVAEKLLAFRRALKSVEDERLELRRVLDSLHQYEDILMGMDQMRQFVENVAGKQVEALEKVTKALKNVEAKVRADVPKGSAPAILLADKEEWHIKVGFAYPDPKNPGKKIRYGAGEALPVNMTQEDCEELYRQGKIYRFERGKDGVTGVFKHHPKLTVLTQAEMYELFKQPLAYISNFLERNYFKLDTLLTMQVALATFEKDTGMTLDPRIKQILARKLVLLEEDATGQKVVVANK